MRWIRVHKLPDYAYFTHRAHVAAGIGCVTCHGRIDTMEVVTQMQPLSMGWCLDCHRNPAPFRRPVSEVTNMKWTPPKDAAALQAKLASERPVSPPPTAPGAIDERELLALARRARTTRRRSARTSSASSRKARRSFPRA